MADLEPQAEECPVCNASLSRHPGSRKANEAHINACAETHIAKKPILSREPTASDSSGAPGAGEGHRPGFFGRLSSKLGHPHQSREEKRKEEMSKVDDLMICNWGPPGSPTYEVVMRYWKATRMEQHWQYLRTHHPHKFKQYLSKGYMEPIPTAWVQDQRLACQNPGYSTFETPAEERLYYLLNSGALLDGSPAPRLRPLNIDRDLNTIIARGNARNSRQVQIAPVILQDYSSQGDVFRSDRRIRSREYSAQVPNRVYQERRVALNELAEGIIHGTDHLETMILIDVSGSMTVAPQGGARGPDGKVRIHDQPPNIRLVQNLVHRALYHMLPRQQRIHPKQNGIDTVVFSSYASYVGQLSADRFREDWTSKVESRLGGGTRVMQGWQEVKNTFFMQQNSMHGHGRRDPTYGWQPTPGMPKLSLLLFLDGEAVDMDEFELDLLGETWAYVTIALVGMENCPHHHSHAIELERVARFNPHVGFFDVHGRVCERLVIKDLLASVYPVDPPEYEEICNPEFDIPPAYGV